VILESEPVPVERLRGDGLGQRQGGRAEHEALRPAAAARLGVGIHVSAVLSRRLVERLQ